MGVLIGRRARGAPPRLRRSLVAVFAIVPALAAAQDSGRASPGRAYAIARIGTALPRGGDLDALGFGAGGAVEVGAGMAVMRHLSVEASAGWIAFQSENVRRIRLYDDVSSPVEELAATRRLDAMPLLATVRASTRLGPVDLHASGGAGAYVVSTDLTVDSSLSGRRSLSARDTALGLHAGAGVAAALSERLTLAVEARYVSARPTFRFDASPTSTTTQPSTSARAARLDAAVVSAAFAYRL